MREQQRRRDCLGAGLVHGLLQGVYREIKDDGRKLGHGDDNTDAVVPGNARSVTGPLRGPPRHVPASRGLSRLTLVSP